MHVDKNGFEIPVMRKSFGPVHLEYTTDDRVVWVRVDENSSLGGFECRIKGVPNQGAANNIGLAMQQMLDRIAENSGRKAAEE